MQKPTLYILCGLPFSGKTVLTREIVKRLGYKQVNIDEIKFAHGYGWADDDHVPDEAWNEIFTESYQKTLDYLQNGNDVIYDCANQDRANRDKLRELAAKRDFPTRVVHLEVPLEIIKERWKRNKKTKERFDLPESIFQAAIDTYEVPTSDERVITYTPGTDLNRWITYNFSENILIRKAGLVSEFIYQIGEYPALRLPSAEIPVNKVLSEEYQTKFRYIKDCLIKYRELTGYGRGITGVQVGIPECFSVIYTREMLLIVINPKIQKQSAKLLRYPEMCMSTNPIIAPVVRPAWIEFAYYDENGQKQFWKTKDDTDFGRMMNRVFQHEIDHMQGIINIDKVASKELILDSDPDFYDNASFEEVKI